MDIEFARLMIRSGFDSSRELDYVIHTYKKHVPPEQHEELMRGFATAVAEILDATVNKATAAFPELEAEIDAAINKYGRY